MGGAASISALPAADAEPLILDDEIKARGYWESVWRTLKKDKAAVGGGISVIVLILMCFVAAPIFAWLLGHGPNEIFDGGLTSSALPYGPWAHFENVPYVGATGHFPTVFFPLGSDGAQGRDEFLRLLYGGRSSLEVAIFATAISITLGVVMGAAAGYFGGWIDMIISRVTELTMAFPVILFVIALSAVAGPELNKITFGFLPEGVFTITLVLSIFGWFYPARIARAQVLSLREKEFVEAARMVGSSDSKIIRSHLFPHLVAPMIVLATISVGQNVLAEAGLSFLGIGIQDPTPSWGNLLEQAQQFYLQVPWLMLWPGLAILITTLSFNLLGDGLRDAFDPRAAR
jgi:peptide/nickel transport system permease protein